MFSTHHRIAVYGWHNQRQTHVLPCAAKAGRVGGWVFSLHDLSVQRSEKSSIATFGEIFVGTSMNTEISEQSLDEHIRDCGRRMIAAHAAGDKADADQWRQRMHDAIKSRSPEHHTRLISGIDSAIWFQGPEALALGRSD